jgi:hypothetical protein
MAKRKFTGVIVSRCDERKLRAKLQMARKDAINRILTSLQFIGESCITIARERGDYNDITGNLRSSIGYIILNGGRVVTQTTAQRTTVAPGVRDVHRKRKDGSDYVAKQKIGGDGNEGARQAEQFLERLKARYPYGCVLIVCAGMEYAAYVENVHGKRVLVDAQLEAEKLLDKLLGKFIEKR